MANLIKEDGIIITEDPSLLEMLKKNAYDQVYAEHMYIWSLSAMNNLLNSFGLEVFEIENNEFHGGCSRYYISKKINKKSPQTLLIIKEGGRFWFKKIRDFL